MMLQKFINRLDAVTCIGDQYKTLCPAHDDKTPSLAVTEKDGKILLKCWAGCSANEITSALGLKLSDLFVDSHLTQQQRLQYAKKRTKHQLRQALAFELHMLYQILSNRITSTELACDVKFIKVRPESIPMPDGEWEREILAVERIRELVNELY